MKSIVLIALANIKRRKLQSLLTASSITLGALLLATTLSLINSMHKPFDHLFEQLKASHLLLFYDHRQEEAEALIQWFEKQAEVRSVSVEAPYYRLEEAMIFKGKEIDLRAQLTERLPGNLNQDQVLILKGEKKMQPALGEIWIPNHLASAYNIHIGDTIGIPIRDGLFPLAVSATVVDPHYASPLFNPTRVWLAPGSLPFFLPISQLNGRMLGVRLKSPNDVDPVWSRFNQNRVFEGRVLKYHLFKSVFLSFYQIISLVLLVFSVLAVFVAAFILHAALSGAIASDHSLIGVYKTLGFTPGDIIAIYLFQYLLLAVLSLPLGLLGSYLLTNAILDSLIQSIGLVNLSFSFFFPFAFTTGLFLILTALSSFLGSLKTRKIKPLAAIRLDPVGDASLKRPFPHLLTYRGISIPAFIGLRMLFANAKRLFYTAFSLLFTIFILVFSINISHSFTSLKNNKPAWGLEDSDLQVRLNKKIALPLEHESFLAMLQKEKAIETVVSYGYCAGTVSNPGGSAPHNLIGKVYADSLAKIGLGTLSGQNPWKENDIALCLLTAKELGKQVGDSLEMFIEGVRKTFFVAGIYQDVSNLGRGFRLTGSAMKALNPLFEPELYAIRLKADVPAEAFKNRLQQTFAETVLPELSVEERKGVQNIIASMRGTLLLVSLFFLAVLFAILFNDALMNIHDFRKSFGIFKTIGLTPLQLRWALVYKALLLSAFCLIIGLPATLFLSPILISGMSEGIGLQDFPYLIQVLGTILSVPSLLLFTGLSAWRASKNVLKITPKNLVAV